MQKLLVTTCILGSFIPTLTFGLSLGGDPSDGPVSGQANCASYFAYKCTKSDTTYAPCSSSCASEYSAWFSSQRATDGIYGTPNENHIQTATNHVLDGNLDTATCTVDCYFETRHSYRCETGYYGKPTDAKSGCSQCPTWSGVYTNSALTTSARGTSYAGATAITECYVASGTYYDATGTFKISGKCEYK